MMATLTPGRKTAPGSPKSRSGRRVWKSPEGGAAEPTGGEDEAMIAAMFPDTEQCGGGDGGGGGGRRDLTLTIMEAHANTNAGKDEQHAKEIEQLKKENIKLKKQDNKETSGERDQGKWGRAGGGLMTPRELEGKRRYD